MTEPEDKHVNKAHWLWMGSYYLDMWRVWPRAFILFYFWLCMQTAVWFMDLPDPTNSQAAFAGAVISAGAAWFGLYVNSGKERFTNIPTHAPFTDPSQPAAPERRRRRRQEEDMSDDADNMDDGPKG
jgi:hypothetical protein